MFRSGERKGIYVIRREISTDAIVGTGERAIIEKQGKEIRLGGGTVGSTQLAEGQLAAADFEEVVIRVLRMSRTD